MEEAAGLKRWDTTNAAGQVAVRKCRRCSAEASAMIGKLDVCVRNVVATPWFVFTSSLSSAKRCADLAALRRTWPHEGRTRQSRRRQGAEKRKSGEAVHPCSDSACMEYLFTFTINLTQICRQLFHTCVIWDGEFGVPQTSDRARHRIFLNRGCCRFTFSSECFFPRISQANRL